MPSCPYCHKINNPGTKFCTGCGKPVAGNFFKCLNCGTVLSAGVKFCTKCGTPSPKGCPCCGAPLNKLAKFCTGCGTPVKEISEEEKLAAEQDIARAKADYEACKSRSRESG